MSKFRWSSLSYKRQLTVTLVGVAFLAQIALGVGVYFGARTILIDRAMNLLTSRNSTALASAMAACDPMTSNCMLGIFTDRAGLGNTGEVYLMAESGRLLSESRFLKNPAPAPIPDNFQTEWRGRKLDYRGIPVFGVWKKVTWGGFTGILASEMDVAEVFQPVQKIWRYLLMFLAFSLIAITLSADVIAKNLSGKTERAAELQKVRRQSLIEGQENERNRIGLELHDDICQEVAALNWHLSTYDLTPQQIDPLRKKIERILGKIRFLAHGLLTNVVSTSGLPESVRNLLLETQGAAAEKGVAIELAIEGEEAAYDKLGNQFTVGVYRIVQEALHNIFKHSRATQVRIQLNLDPDAGLNVVVQDNGVGLSDSRSRSISGHGIKNMQSRAEALRGQIRMDSLAQGGVRLEAKFDREAFL